MSLYTKFGDAGKTQLYGGAVVSKADPRTHAYGTVDELSSLLGVVLAEPLPDELRLQLLTVQRSLYRAGADLATPHQSSRSAQSKVPHDPARTKRITAEHVAEVERWIDDAEARIPPLTEFILPGGTRTAALLHQARTVCRRAERWAVALSEHEGVNPPCLKYLNRLGDYLFAVARLVNAETGVGEMRADS